MMGRTAIACVRMDVLRAMFDERARALGRCARAGMRWVWVPLAARAATTRRWASREQMNA